MLSSKIYKSNNCLFRFLSYIRRYGKYTKKVNGELTKGIPDICHNHNCSNSIIDLVVYDWFERENGSRYKLDLTKEQYEQMKTILSPIGIRFSLLIRLIKIHFNFYNRC